MTSEYRSKGLAALLLAVPLGCAEPRYEPSNSNYSVPIRTHYVPTAGDFTSMPGQPLGAQYTQLQPPTDPQKLIDATTAHLYAQAELAKKQSRQIDYLMVRQSLIDFNNSMDDFGISTERSMNALMENLQGLDSSYRNAIFQVGSQLYQK